MDVENLKSWASQPDVCRCCLSASGTWDLTASHITDAGIKEVYCDMIHECFGINLSYLSEWGPSRLICTLCVGHLRDACSFRKQVLRAEEHFIEYFINRKGLETVKTEVERECLEAGCLRYDLPTAGRDEVDAIKTEEYDSPGHDEAAASDNDYETVEIFKQNTRKTLATEQAQIRRKARKIRRKTKRKRKKTTDDDDSDTPIARLSKKNQPSDLSIKVDNREDVENIQDICDLNDKSKVGGDKVNISNTGPEHIMQSKIGMKQVSERKRIIITCNTVLRDTTACPFRHHKSWFRCFFCSQDFMEINLLRDHNLQTHSNVDDELKSLKRYPRSLQIDISNLECRHCSLNLTDVDSMRRHFVDVHDKTIYSECIADYKVDVSPYTCHLCKQEFHVFRTLTTHLNEHYANCICDVCGKSFLNSKRLKVHKRTHEDGQYPCNECGKVLKTKTSKANHMESAHSKRQLKCQICYKPVKHYNDRIKHMSEVHNITHKFKCPICPREYNIKHYLATHIRQTHGSKNKKCTECGMGFITNHGLKKHMLKHSGDKPFACTLCCKSYARSYTLREHMRSHENDRNRAQMS